MTINDLIERHGVDSVEQQFYLLDIFNSQYNPETDGDRETYLMRRLMSYHENLGG